MQAVRASGLPSPLPAACPTSPSCRTIWRLAVSQLGRCLWSGPVPTVLEVISAEHASPSVGDIPQWTRCPISGMASIHPTTLPLQSTEPSLLPPSLPPPPSSPRPLRTASSAEPPVGKKAPKSPAEPECLYRATLGNKKISTKVTAKDVNKFTQSCEASRASTCTVVVVVVVVMVWGWV